ncbi:MAG: type II toxin-antitoxin system YafQ family toxin [Candidatus Cryptobacteroides sp.]|nr:type II toxin-antitoxin system YafQ family toxin [Candidatus Cryptobacteroides sp.]
MRTIVLSGQYKKDLKLARKRNLPEDELNKVIFNLANDISLPQENKDHALSGNLAGFRECHIKPDWLLIYGKEDNGELHILNLVRTGTHSDLFKK